MSTRIATGVVAAGNWMPWLPATGERKAGENGGVFAAIRGQGSFISHGRRGRHKARKYCRPARRMRRDSPLPRRGRVGEGVGLARIRNATLHPPACSFGADPRHQKGVHARLRRAMGEGKRWHQRRNAALSDEHARPQARPETCDRNRRDRPFWRARRCAT